MEQKKSKWVPRSKEWIKANPGKGTMYKVIDGQEVPPDVEGEVKVEVIQRKAWTKFKPTLTSGVYTVICEAEKCVYVGQSANTLVRLRNHKMNIISEGGSAEAIYTKMRAHCKRHGIDSFSFDIYEMLPNVDQKTLLERESVAMLDFVKRGYILYNRQISTSLREECIYCPQTIQPLIASVVKVLTDSPDHIEKFDNLIKELLLPNEML